MRRLALLVAVAGACMVRPSRPGFVIGRRLLVTWSTQPGGQPVLDGCSSLVMRSDGESIAFGGYCLTPSAARSRGIVFAWRGRRPGGNVRRPRVLFGPRPHERPLMRRSTDRV